MVWRDHLLRLLVRGLLLPSGEQLDTERAIRVLDRINEDPELLERLEGETEEQVRNTFLELYREESSG